MGRTKLLRNKKPGYNPMNPLPCRHVTVSDKERKRLLKSNVSNEQFLKETITCKKCGALLGPFGWRENIWGG
jgi:hypothetical protein